MSETDHQYDDSGPGSEPGAGAGAGAGAEKSFRGWRLLGIIMSVVVVLAIISFVVDWIVIGPLEGRVF